MRAFPIRGAPDPPRRRMRLFCGGNGVRRLFGGAGPFRENGGRRTGGVVRLAASVCGFRSCGRGRAGGSCGRIGRRERWDERSDASAFARSTPIVVRRFARLVRRADSPCKPMPISRDSLFDGAPKTTQTLARVNRPPANRRRTPTRRPCAGVRSSDDPAGGPGDRRWPARGRCPGCGRGRGGPAE